MKLITSLFACLVVLVPAAGSATAAPVNLRIALTTAAGGLADQQAEAFKEIIDEKIPGYFDIKVFPGSQLGTGSENVQAVQLGTLEAAALGSEGAAVDPLLSLFEVPWIFKDVDHFNKVATGSLFPELETVFREHNMELIGVYGTGFREILATKPIKSLADMEGMRVRIAPSPARLEMFKELGAIPVTVQWSDAYLALERGTVQAVEAFPIYLRSGKMYEAAKYMARLQYVTQPRYLVVSSALWEEISPEAQKVLKDAGQQSMNEGTVLAKQMEVADIDFMKDQGVTVVPTDLTGFEKIRAKLLESYIEEHGDSWIKIVDAAR